MIHATYELRAKQQTILTPRLQQSVKLLQMSAVEFTQELRQALSTNPFLEETADEDEAAVESVLDAAAGDLPEPEVGDITATEVAPEPAADAELAYEPPGEYSGDFPTSRANGSGDDRMDFGEWMHEAPDLHEHLHRELAGYRLSERDSMLAHVLIEALDDDGYLRQEFEDLEGLLEFTSAPSTSEWNTALRLVQQLDAPGLAARNLGECLRLQLLALDAATPGRAVALRITEKCLEQLARRNQSEMLRILGCEEDELRDACLLIRSLNPKPGLRFAREEAQHIIPDVIVRKVKGRWFVDTNPAVMPRARLNSTYATMFRHARCNDRAPMAQELQEARWLIRNVEQRFTTIQRVAEAIVAHQRTFFEYGEVALKPLVLREVAEELGLHESTVSRATGNKYMATPRGIFEFKHFFSRELSTETGGTCSTTAVRALIKELIASEDAAAPLSDVTLTQMLAKQGVIVARRTVSKYRTLMKVPPAELRRQF